MRNLFKKKDGSAEYHERQKAAVDITRYDKSDLEKKAESRVPMTYEETAALNAYHQKDIVNEVLRIIGLFGFLFFIVLAIGTYLYPYSIFNFISTSDGGQDTFWNLWSNINFYIGMKDSQPINSYVSSNGYETLGTMYSHAFIESTPKENFVVLGAWSIIPLATIGLIAVIWLAAYIAAFSIKDLINMIHRLGLGTAQAFESVVITGKQAIDETIPAQEQKKELDKKPIKSDVDETLAKDDTEAKIAKMKKDIAEEEDAKSIPSENITPIKVAPEPAHEKQTEKKDLAALSDDDLNKLLNK
jgi:hypothetical protein